MYWLISSTIYLQSLVHEYFLIWQLNTACLNVYICNYNDWSPTEQYLIVSSLWENTTRALRAVGKFYYRKGIWKVYERDLVLIFTICLSQFWMNDKRHPSKSNMILSDFLPRNCVTGETYKASANLTDIIILTLYKSIMNENLHNYLHKNYEQSEMQLIVLEWVTEDLEPRYYEIEALFSLVGST